MTAALLLALAAPLAPAAPPATRTIELTPHGGFADNPMKGFVPFRADYADWHGDAAFPHALEFQYVPLADLMDGPDSFTFEDGLEPVLKDVAGRGHRLVLRPFLDYPGRKSTGVPKFLRDAGLKMRRYKQFGGGRSPDYENERLVAALESFIEALGERYDGDPRLGVVQTGLLGHWGEWHTYPKSQWFASEKTQRRVLAAYEAAFDATPLMVRYPSDVTLDYPLGFYDDSFALATLPTGREEDDWFYLAQLKAEGGGDVWKTRIIGGEVRPELQPILFAPGAKGREASQPEYLDPDEAKEQVQDFAECVRQTHASWLINQHVFDDEFEPGERDRALRAAKSLGYRFCATAATLSRDGAEVTVKLTFENRGVAPFYHDWPARLAVSDAAGKEVAAAAADWGLPAVMPGDSVTRTVSLTLPKTAAGLKGLTAAVSIPDPLPGAKPLRFANAETGDDGALRLGELP